MPNESTNMVRFVSLSYERDGLELAKNVIEAKLQAVYRELDEVSGAVEAEIPVVDGEPVIQGMDLVETEVGLEAPEMVEEQYPLFPTEQAA
jgi:hypothetical protein